MDKSQITVILSDGWVGPRGAKDLCDDRGSAPGFVRRSFAPTPAPALSLRMTLGWFGLPIATGGRPQTRTILKVLSNLSRYADVLVPQVWLCGDECTHHVDAGLILQHDDFDAAIAQ